MRILYLTPSFQHPAMRGPTRCYYFAKALGRRHEVTLLAQSKEPVAPEAMKEMEACCDRVLVVRTGSPDPAGSLLAGIPRIGRRLAEIREERRAVARLGEVMAEELRRGTYDVVLFHGKSIASALEGLDGVPLVVDFCDATSLRVRSRMQHARPAKAALLLLRWLETRRVERRLLRRTPHQAFISARDRDAVLGPGASATVVPIGVDTGHFTRRAPPADSSTIVFTGVLSYHPNADAALFLVDEVLPRLRRAIPGVRVRIVGRDPAPALRERAERDPAVTVTGFVPDLRPHLEAASVAVAPVRYGAGVQNKVLEAMAMELPVVATRFVAGGLRAPGGEEAPLAVGDGPDGFADQVAYLLRNPQAARDLGLRGRRFVEEHHVWARSAEILEMLCMDAVKARER